MEVQIFGTKKCSDTRKAQRFFAERRLKTHFVDLQQRAASPGELRRFAERFGVGALVDRDGKRYADQGLASAHLSDERWLARLADDPLLLRTPLVRWSRSSPSASRLKPGTRGWQRRSRDAGVIAHRRYRTAAMFGTL